MGIYSAQFDHPYSDAYCEELAGLADREKKTLLEMASRSTKESASFLGTLLLELASFGDRDVGESIARWTKPPPADNRTMPQSNIHAFVAAHIALGRLGCPLPVHRTAGETPSERALKACGTILYWCNRVDLDEEGRREACASAVEVLTQHGDRAALDVLRECEDVWRDGWDLLPGDEPVVRSVVGLFPGRSDRHQPGCALRPHEPGRILSALVAFRRRGGSSHSASEFWRGMETGRTVRFFVNMRRPRNSAGRRLRH